MSKNKNLHQAKEAKNDEFYTELSDIEKELKYYKDFFKDKIVYCNCDDARESNFFKYFSINFEPLGLKKLITTGYKKGGHGVLLEYEGDKNGNRKVDDSEITVTELKGDGDFRSEECIKILETCDVVVTNCPFSLFREYVAQLMKYKKKFLIIGNMNAITYKEIFPYIKNNELWFGVSIHSGDREFKVPDSYPLKAAGYRVDKEGNKYIRVKGVRWFTNISNENRNKSLDLYKKYNPKDFPKYDNYLAFNVDKVDEIPCDKSIEIEIDEKDYDRWKAAYGDDVEIIKEGENNKKKIRIHKPVYVVPITFLDKYCPDQFEIVAFRKGEDGKDLIFFWEEEREFNLTFVSLFDSDPGNDKKCRRESEWKNYLCKNNDKNDIEPVDYFFPLSTNLKNGLVNDCTINKKKTYVRILIRKK